MRGFFVMVSRDAATYQAAAVNPLLVETEEEQEMFRIAQSTTNPSEPMMAFEADDHEPCGCSQQRGS